MRKKDALLYDNRMWAWAVFIIIEKDLDVNGDVDEKESMNDSSMENRRVTE